MILLLTADSDEHVDHLASKLEQRGAAFLRFDPGDFPAASELTLSYAAGRLRSCVLRRGGTALDLCELRAAWYRRPSPPSPHTELRDDHTRQFVAHECRTFLQDVWSALDCLWLPGPPATTRHAGQKATQLGIAGELGFELPPTLITNSADELLAFFREHGGEIISKPTGDAQQVTGIGQHLVRYTELVTRRDLAHVHALAYCPMIFQAYVAKRLELRITVVGERVFPAEIHSQTSHHTRVDWRRFDAFQLPHRPHALPAEVERRCVALVRRLGLRYGAIDMVLTPDGRYVFLEINPNGQYLWIEQETGLPISDAICDLLVTGTSPRLEPPVTSHRPHAARGERTRAGLQ